MNRMTICFSVVMTLAAIFCTPVLAAQKNVDVGILGEFPVLHEGRIKPLESLARAEMERVTGRKAFGHDSATAWLAETLFDPARASGQKIFAVRGDNLRRQLKLTDSDQKYFSLQDISTGLAATESLLPALLQKDFNTLTMDQKALLDLHDRAFLYAGLLGSLSLILPLEGAGSDVTYLDLKKNEVATKQKLAKIMRRKGTAAESYTEEEAALALAGLQIAVLESEAGKNNLFKVIPPQWPGQVEWLAPWESLDTGYGSPWSAQFLNQWQAMAKAYRAGDRDSWRESTRAALENVHVKAGASVSLARLTAERIYNDLRPLLAAQILYAAAFLLLLASAWARAPKFRATAIAVAVTAMVLHVIGIIMRIYILSRPPVGTLFESLLFVALIVVVCALLLEYARRDGIVLLSGLASAFSILLISPIFAPDGDSMQMLVAVLNTNFWLATHVVFITSGYGVCVFAAVLGHMALYGRAFGAGVDQKLEKSLNVVLLAGLFFTAVGTVLGGIWADQSWGRFWGWDPKENGALLIVLWVIWVLHGKLGGFLSIPAYLAAVSFLATIVALSWFGVNLLNVGLHSYGFTSGMAAGLFIFCAMETALICAALIRIRMKTHAA